MTLFDLIAIVILLVSALVGFSRGAVRELVTVFAFTLSTMAALYMTPVSGPFMRRMMHPTWAANAAAIIIVFILAYVLLRLIGHWVTSRLHEQTALGAIDRTIGLGFGVVRALVILGAFYLIFNIATPHELAPSWIVEAKLYPVARESGRILGALAPNALKASGRLGPELQRAVSDDGANDNVVEPAPPPENQDAPSAAQSRNRIQPHKSHGYDKRSREDIDALVERSR